MDMVASHLRAQIVTLHNVLESMERHSSYREEYIIESIKSAENELRRLRKSIES